MMIQTECTGCGLSVYDLPHEACDPEVTPENLRLGLALLEEAEVECSIRTVTAVKFIGLSDHISAEAGGRVAEVVGKVRAKMATVPTHR